MACLLSGCAPNNAPVIERTVQDARPDPARSRTAVQAPAPIAAPAKYDKPVVNATAAPKGEKPATGPTRPGSSALAEGEDWRPDTYSVRQGDTLYAIALDHGQDYRDLATWNNLSDPNVIRVGQLLRVKAPAGWSERAEADEADVRPMQTLAPIQAAPLEPVVPPPLVSAPRAVKAPYSAQALAQLTGVPYTPPAPAPTKPVPAKPDATAVAPPTGSVSRPPAIAATNVSVGPASGSGKPAQPNQLSQPTQPQALPAAAPPAGTWAWPVRGRLLQSFDSGSNPKGIAIAAPAGEAVLASAPGRVVYSGSGLRGYGKLVIVKHDRNYLSVYAHNSQLLVKEGERVGRGQKIAEVGSSESNRVALHFEIRKLGKPVNPLQYLAPL